MLLSRSAFSHSRFLLGLITSFALSGLLLSACSAGDGGGGGKDTDGDGIPDSEDPDIDGDGIPNEEDPDIDGDGVPNDEDDDDDGGGDDGAGIDSIDFGSGGNQSPNGKVYCQNADVNFVPRTPTVYVLVDRSSSMFESTDYWGKLKTAVLPVLSSLQAKVRFGFASYTGSSAMCPQLDAVATIAENNYASIEAFYNGLGAPTKGETPTAAAIKSVRETLLADDSPGDRFILLVSDGNPDFCDDGGVSCGADALIAELQKTANLGVQTLVFGIENAYVTNQLFDYFAQAGWGEKPNWADGLDVGTHSGKIYSECNGQRPGWLAQRTELGRTGFVPNGEYDAAGGTKTAFLNTDPAALATQIESQVSGLKSCILDLGDSGVEVKAGSEGQGDIFVNEVLIPKEQWKMNSTTVLELMGAACDTWKQPEVTKFFAGFPCEALVVK